jgi:hypothetical protein
LESKSRWELAGRSEDDDEEKLERKREAGDSRVEEGDEARKSEDEKRREKGFGEEEG